MSTRSRCLKGAQLCDGKVENYFFKLGFRHPNRVLPGPKQDHLGTERNFEDPRAKLPITINA